MSFSFMGLVSSIFILVSVLIFTYSPCVGLEIMNMFFMKDAVSTVMLFMTSLVSVVYFLSEEKESQEGSGSGVLVMCGGVFMTVSLFSFFFFFEGSMVCMVMMVVAWGNQPERLQAGVYMFMYSVSSSIPLLISFFVVWGSLGTDFMVLASFSETIKFFNSLSWSLIMMSFLVKLPIFSLHSWLPKAHVEASIGGSIILAGVMLKVGGYGAMRVFWVLGFSCEVLKVMFMSMGLWGGLIASFICLGLVDMKEIIAYSSISHMAMVLISIMSVNKVGWGSASLLMFAHGLSSPLMFSVCFSIYSIYSSRSIMVCKGLKQVNNLFSWMWFIAVLLNFSCPPSLGFVGEIMSMMSVVSISYFYLMIFGVMIIIITSYSIMMYSSASHSIVSNVLPSSSMIKDRWCILGMVCILYLVFMVIMLDMLVL